MNQASVPAYYFPTSVMLVTQRDSLVFDQGISVQVSSQLEQAAQLVKQASYFDKVYQQCFSENFIANMDPDSTKLIELSLKSISQQIYNPKRFDETTLLVVDDSLPQHEVLRFWDDLADVKIKKCWISQDIYNAAGLGMLNQQRVHTLVDGRDFQWNSGFYDQLRALQQGHFVERTSLISEILALPGSHCLLDAAFSAFFHSFCQQHHIVEYYLFERSGSFLLINRMGEASCLIIKNQQDLQHYSELAIDQHAPSASLQQLQQGERIPCFNLDELPPDHAPRLNWDSCLHPAEQLQGIEKYYYAWITELPEGFLARDKMVSFAHYLGYVTNPRLVAAQ